jgi:hypothetical protein
VVRLCPSALLARTYESLEGLVAMCYICEQRPMQAYRVCAGANDPSVGQANNHADRVTHRGKGVGDVVMVLY